MLEIQNLSAGYGPVSVLQDLCLTIPGGQVTVLLGPNGCGKTTLLKALAGLLPMTGEARLEGRSLPELSRKQRARLVSYLPQNRPVPEITVEKLVLHGRFPYLDYPRKYRPEDLAAAGAALEALRLRDLARRPLGSLSGGQRQRAYLAMALAQDTSLLLLDEPTAYLDIAAQLQLMDLARDLARRGKTVVLVLHDLSLALEYADRIAVLSQGRVLGQGTAEQVLASGALDRAFGVRMGRTFAGGKWRWYWDGPLV